MARTTSLSEDLTRQALLDSPDDTDTATDDSEQPVEQPTDQATEQPEEQPTAEEPVGQPQPAVHPQSVQSLLSTPAQEWPDPRVAPDGTPYYTDQPAAPQPQPTAGGGEGQPAPGGVEIPESTGGFNVTHYGYAGDAYWDSNSGAGIGDADNQLSPGYSAALSRSARQNIFGVDSTQSTGREFQYGGKTYRDDDTSPSRTANIDIYDPGYGGTDPGVSQDLVNQRRQIQRDTGGGDQGVADFFSKRGDSPITDANDPRLTDVNVGDQDWRVNEEAAPYFQGFLSDLAAAGAPTRSDGGWNYREKVGAKGLSEHAYGGAIDVNQEGRNEVTPEFNSWIKANPGVLQSLENKWNIYGGERFGDLGHFEWNGVSAAKAQPMQVPRAGEPTVKRAQLPMTWEMGDQPLFADEQQAHVEAEKQQESVQMAQLADRFKGQQSLPGLIRDLDTPVPGIDPYVQAQFKKQAQDELSTASQKAFNEPDPQKALAKGMSDVSPFDVAGDFWNKIIGNLQGYELPGIGGKPLAGGIPGSHMMPLSQMKNDINSFFAKAGINGDQAQHDFMTKVNMMSPEDRANTIASLLPPSIPGVTTDVNQPSTNPTYLANAFDKISHDPNYEQEEEQERNNLRGQIAQNLNSDPRLKGTGMDKFTGATASAITDGIALANPVTYPLLAAKVNEQMRDQVKAEHPDWTDDQVQRASTYGTLVSLLGQVGAMHAFGAVAEPLLSGIQAPVTRFLARVGVGAAGGGTTMAGAQALTNVLQQRPWQTGVGEAAITGGVLGAGGAAMGGPGEYRGAVEPEAVEAPTPAEAPAAPEVLTPPAPRPVTGAEVTGPEREEVAPTYAPSPISTRIAEGERILTPSLLQEAIRNLPENLPTDELTRRIQEIQGAEMEAPREVRFEPGEELQQPGITRAVSEDPLEAFAREQAQQPVITEPEQAPTTTTPVPEAQPEGEPVIIRNKTLNIGGRGTGLEEARSRATQRWNVGDVVNVGFLRGLTVVGQSDEGYVLRSQNGVNYHSIPHSGITRISEIEANRLLKEAPAPVPTPEAQPEGGKVTPAPVTGETEPIPTTEPWRSEVANQFVQPKLKPGEEIPPGTSKSAREIIDRGVQMSPEEINQHIADIMKMPDAEEQIAALRTKESLLARESAKLTEVAEGMADNDPNKTQAQLDADNARKAWLEYSNGPMAKARNLFHQFGRGMQGSEPIDLSTFDGMQKQWMKDTADPVTGKTREPSENAKQAMRRTADAVKNAQNGEAEILGRVDKVLKSRKIMDPEEARRQIAEEMKGFPCIVAAR